MAPLTGIGDASARPVVGYCIFRTNGTYRPGDAIADIPSGIAALSFLLGMLSITAKGAVVESVETTSCLGSTGISFYRETTIGAVFVATVQLTTLPQFTAING